MILGVRESSHDKRESYGRIKGFFILPTNRISLLQQVRFKTLHHRPRAITLTLIMLLLIHLNNRLPPIQTGRDIALFLLSQFCIQLNSRNAGGDIAICYCGSTQETRFNMRKT
nr:hypothetical protein [Tanacetum cinerariifolium]